MINHYQEYLLAFWHILVGYRTHAERSIASERAREIAPYIDLSKPLFILDLANGNLRPQYSILRAEGHSVYGIDRINRPPLTWMERANIIARGIYSLYIPSPASHSHKHRLVCGDAAFLPFQDDFFDLVTSVAAFEHFLDASAVIAEMHRVIKSGGLSYIRIHPFTCPSGGHNVKLMEIPLRTIPKEVDAWDHLRSRRLPFHVPLNKWRINQYLEVFSQHFEIVNHYCAMQEGEHLLTPEIEAELSDYSREELTCGAYVIVVRKP